MPNVGHHYVKEMYRKFSYFAAWLPGISPQPGDVGRKVDGHFFNRLTSLEEIGVKFKVRKGLEPMTFSYRSDANLLCESGGAVPQAPLPAQNTAAITFACRGAFCFEAMECFVDEIENKAEIAEAVRELARINRWSRDYTVVDRVVRSGSTTLFLAHSEAAAMVLSAPANTLFDRLADPHANLKVQKQEGEMVSIMAEKGLAPLFTLMRVKDPFWDFITNEITFSGKRSGAGLPEGGIGYGPGRGSLYEFAWEAVAPGYEKDLELVSIQAKPGREAKAPEGRKIPVT